VNVRLSETKGKWVLAVAVLGSAVVQLEATVVNVALPSIGRDLNATVSGLQWTINGYLLTLASLILIAGSLGDHYGRRRLFLIGLVWFTAASVLCALATSTGVLVAARVVQGIGGALLTPGSLAILQATIHPDDRGRAIGAWSALGGVAAAVGPLVGGWLVAAASWRWVFVLNIPLGIFVAIMARRHVPESRDPSARPGFDFPGALLITLALGGLTYALIAAGSAAFSSPKVLVPAVTGVLAMVAFVVLERHSRHPMLPLDIFASQRFTAANLVTFVVYGALGGVFFLLVVELQTALGYSPVKAGAATLPITALMLVLSPRAGALAQRIGPRPLLTTGPLLIAAGMLLMRRIGPGSSYVGDVLPAVVVFGLGLSATVAPVTATVLAAAEDRYAGVASGVNNAVARTAQLVAVAALPVIAGLSGSGYRVPGELTHAFHTAMLVTAATAALGGLLAWLTIGKQTLPIAEEPEPYHCAVDGPPLKPAAERAPA
jgi:EmrB/QacA subfamily drug resistance transporter